MAEAISLTIDGVHVQVPSGSTLLDAARAADREVPTVCYHEALTPPGLCRVCVVEVEGARTLPAACVTPAQEGMVVHTRSPRVERVRRTILAMLASAVDVREDPNLQALLQDYDAQPEAFAFGARRDVPVIDDNPMYVRDYSQCILCWRCVQACGTNAQYVFALTWAGRGFDTRISTFYDVPMPESPCVFCGQCVAVCPTGALKPRRAFLLDQGHTTADLVHFAAIDVSPVHPPATRFAAAPRPDEP